MPDIDVDVPSVDDETSDTFNDIADTVFGGPPIGARVVVNPLNLVQFATGFAVGSNLTKSDETLYGCERTLSNNIIVNGITFSKNVLSTDPPKLFEAAYSMWDIFYFSD